MVASYADGRFAPSSAAFNSNQVVVIVTVRVFLSLIIFPSLDWPEAGLGWQFLLLGLIGLKAEV
jgi:hypothetical protein